LFGDLDMDAMMIIQLMDPKENARMMYGLIWLRV
jgi:hypothetical protein